jgi:hypothetical protein
MPLRRARHAERSARLKIAADVIEPMHLCWVGEAVISLVQDQRIVFPRIPVAENHIHELVGSVVPGAMRHVFGAAEVFGFRAVERCHDVPGGAALKHQIHRREDACHVVRLVIGGGIGRAEAQPLCHHPHRHEDRAWVHLHRPHPGGDRLAVLAGIDVGQRQAVVEERHLDLPVLQRARNALVVLRRQKIRHRRRVAPRAGQVRAVLRLQKRDQRHHPLRGRHKGGLV